MMEPVSKTAEEKIQKRTEEWMKGKSTSGLLAANPELLEKRYDDEGNFQPFFGRTENTTDIMRNAIEGARIAVRPDLLTRWNAKLFPGGLAFANEGREKGIGQTNELLKKILQTDRTISELPSQERVQEIARAWPDEARWEALRAEVRRYSPGNLPVYEAIRSQGSNTFTARFDALLSGRRNFAQHAYDFGAFIGGA